ncbi:MAG: hypothetical protein ABJK64_11325 [Paraglaciecola sp.]|uniref:hypothetical protein n=1 Tax=Paraglaciecola sp. TaxID=1920173 RepID=UPI003299F1B7
MKTVIIDNRIENLFYEVEQAAGLMHCMRIAAESLEECSSEIWVSEVRSFHENLDTVYNLIEALYGKYNQECAIAEVNFAFRKLAELKDMLSLLTSDMPELDSEKPLLVHSIHNGYYGIETIVTGAFNRFDDFIRCPIKQAA